MKVIFTGCDVQERTTGRCSCGKRRLRGGPSNVYVEFLLLKLFGSCVERVSIVRMLNFSLFIDIKYQNF
jgi:hypothetical protein